jgi:hypothetical protein
MRLSAYQKAPALLPMPFSKPPASPIMPIAGGFFFRTHPRRNKDNHGLKLGLAKRICVQSKRWLLPIRYRKHLLSLSGNLTLRKKCDEDSEEFFKDSYGRKCLAQNSVIGSRFPPLGGARRFVRKGSQIHHRPNANHHGSKLELAKRVCDPLVEAVSRSACADLLP